MTALPTGTVTFLFTDVEGSTKLLHELGSESYSEALAEHRRVLREAFARHGGVEVDTQGDAFFVAFATAPSALGAAREAQQSLSIPVRMGIHTGTPLLTGEGYIGPDVHKAARIAAAGHGGQVLVSEQTAKLVEADLRDLGEHRLKDLSAPERIYQPGAGEFPPLKTLYRTNLPVPATPFLGRERELAEIGELLERGDLRVLTLTGPGGTGKTRLSLQAAGEASEQFPDGVFWVPLAPLRDPTLVTEQAAQALGASDGLAEHLADKRLLLLLDNFEHVIEASEELHALVSACPDLQLLVTSRELLRVPGEQAYPVPPLEPPEGTELFVSRARAGDPAFSPTPAVTEVCARLDNLPLALELAAARVRVLSPEQLLERLSKRLDLLKAGRGVDPRQQTLRATIEWSHELLDLEEQQQFARLSVFRGGCTLEAAEEVCQADIDALQSLVDKSLLRFNEDRFWMLETIREYAAERLEREAEQVRERHAEYFLAFALEAYPHLRGDPGDWLARLENEHDNLRAALDWLEEAGKTQLVLELAGTLSRFWYLNGHVTEPRRRLEAALARDDLPTSSRARALTGLAMVENAAGDFEGNRVHAAESLELHQRLGDAVGAAHAQYMLGNAASGERDWATAHRIYENSVRLFRELGEDHYALLAMRALAWTTSELGDEERARTLFEELLPLACATGNKRIEARALTVQAGFAREEARFQDALSLATEALRLDFEIGEFTGIGQSLSNIAATLVLTERPATAVELIASEHARHEEKGVAVPSWVADRDEETLATARGALDDASFAEAWERGRGLSLDEAAALALEASTS